MINTDTPWFAAVQESEITVPAPVDRTPVPGTEITRAVQSAQDRRDALTRAAALVDQAREALAQIDMGPVLYGVQSPGPLDEPVLSDLPIRAQDAQVLLDADRDLHRMTTCLVRAGGAYGAHLHGLEVRRG